MKRPFYLMIFIIVIMGTGWLLYQAYTAPSLTSGACTSSEKPVYQTIERETDHTIWCLSNLRRSAIRWQWSPDNSRFAYALQDKFRPTRQLSGRWGYIHVDNLNWFVMSATGFGHKRFSTPDPFGFSFSPDGQYATFAVYNDYGTTRYEIVKISGGQVVCRYHRYNLWYGEDDPPCEGVKLKDGRIWNIKEDVNRSACEYHVRDLGWPDFLKENGCEDLLAGTDLSPTPHAMPEVQATATPDLTSASPVTSCLDYAYPGLTTDTNLCLTPTPFPYPTD
jgi:hypothetical protein